MSGVPSCILAQFKTPPTPAIDRQSHVGIKILVVEDEAIIAADLQQRLESLGYEVIEPVYSGEEVMRAAAVANPDLVLMDITLRGAMTGIEAAAELQHIIDVPIVYATSHGDQVTLQRAFGTCPFGYILKPFSDRELQATIEIAVYRHQLEAKLKSMERWLATTLFSIGDAVIATDIAQRITLFNAAAEKITGYPYADAIGQPFANVLRISGSLENDLTRFSAGTFVGPIAAESGSRLFLRPKSGTRIPIEGSVNPLRDTAGKVCGHVVVVRDSSERYRVEEKLRTCRIG